jgi:NitT/TauT family transport system permease protein
VSVDAIDAQTKAAWPRVRVVKLDGFWRGASYLLVPVGLLAVWHVLAIVFSKSLGPFFPSPGAVAAAWFDWATGATGVTVIYSGQLIVAIVASVRRIAIAFGIAVLLGIPLGILVGWLPSLRRIADPTLQLIRPIPVTAWVPISMLWFGIGDVAAIYLIVLAAFFPVYLNTLQGVRYVDPVVIRAGRMLGARGARLLTHVVLPAALPSIFAGLRISVGFSWMAVVASELVAVKSGLGYVMFEAYGFLRADIVLAAMITIGMLGFLSDRIMVSLEKRALRWTSNERDR